MTMLMIQAALWVLAAFLLGYVIGRLLKALLCREEADPDAYGINELVIHHEEPDGHEAIPKVAAGMAATGAVMAGTAALAQAGRDIDPHKPIVTDPYRPIITDPYKAIVTDPHKPILTDPYKIITTNPHQPIVVDPYKSVVDQPATVSADIPGVVSGTPDAATLTAVAAGAGMAARVAVSAKSTDTTGRQTAVEFDRVADDMADSSETDWLRLLVQQVKNAYRGYNPRAVSRLWQGDKSYDCSAIQHYESVTLEPAHYDQLGSIHCGVPRAGFVAVGGDVSNIGEKTAILFHYNNIVVCRDANDKHHFIRIEE